MLKDKLGFAEQQEKVSYGLGFQLTITRKTDKSVLKTDNATNIEKIKINAIEWYVPPYTPSISNKAILSTQIFSEVPTELHYVEISTIMKEVKTLTYLYG